jgi:hypothetical protein
MFKEMIEVNTEYKFIGINIQLHFKAKFKKIFKW